MLIGSLERISVVVGASFSIEGQWSAYAPVQRMHAGPVHTCIPAAPRAVGGLHFLTCFLIVWAEIVRAVQNYLLACSSCCCCWKRVLSLPCLLPNYTIQKWSILACNAAVLNGGSCQKVMSCAKYVI